jgi:hypothetical protein
MGMGDRSMLSGNAHFGGNQGAPIYLNDSRVEQNHSPESDSIKVFERSFSICASESNDFDKLVFSFENGQAPHDTLGDLKKII